MSITFSSLMVVVGGGGTLGCAPRGALAEFYDANGLLNEFALMYDVRKTFPFHYDTFRQYASHVPHEGDSENTFSQAGNLSDPNMNPHNLATLTKIGAQAKVYMPPKDKILERYMLKYGRNGILPEEDEEDMGFAQTEPAPVPAVRRPPCADPSTVDFSRKSLV